MAGRRKRRAPRELYLSSRQSRLTDVGEINTKSTAVLFAWKVLWRHKLFIATLTRYGRPSKNRGTPKQDDHADALRARCWFVDSIGWTTVATSPNVMLGPAAFDSRFGQRSARNCQKKDG